jgi:hypothetical protein
MLKATKVQYEGNMFLQDDGSILSDRNPVLVDFHDHWASLMPFLLLLVVNPGHGTVTWTLWLRLRVRRCLRSHFVVGSALMRWQLRLRLLRPLRMAELAARRRHWLWVRRVVGRCHAVLWRQGWQDEGFLCRTED